MSETLLTTRKFKVERREHHLPGQKPMQSTLVIHPGAVLIIPVLSPEHIVMIWNYRYSAERELLELPAGTMEPPEPPAVCAARELEEETGYTTKNIEPLAQFYTSPGITNELMHVFVARDLTLASQNLDEHEKIRVEPMGLAEAIEATLDGRIIDGKTIAALHLYGCRRGGGA